MSSLEPTVGTTLPRVPSSVATPSGTLSGVIRLGLEQEDVQRTEPPSLQRRHLEEWYALGSFPQSPPKVYVGSGHSKRPRQ